MKVQTKTLSLMYDPQEDRMKLIINMDDVDRIEFWVTRHFYFSLLFKLETFLEQLQIAVPKPAQSKNRTKVHKKAGESSFIVSVLGSPDLIFEQLT